MEARARSFSTGGGLHPLWQAGRPSPLV